MSFLNIIKDLLDKLALEVVMLEPNNLQAFGVLMNRLDELTGIAEDNSSKDIAELCKGIKSIATTVVLGEIDSPDESITQIYEGISLLQVIVEDDEQGLAGSGKVSDFLIKCGLKSDKTPKQEESVKPPDEKKADSKLAAEVMPDLAEDKELIESFIVEAMENFRDIEVSIVELEQDPGNIDIINDIFRPFHTIKGVSGFLNLSEINHLTHEVETLLDDARDQRLVIDENIIDIVLAAIDLTKAMLDNLSEQINTGIKPPVDFELDNFLKRLKDTAYQGNAGEPETKTEKHIKTDDAQLKEISEPYSIPLDKEEEITGPLESLESIPQKPAIPSSVKEQKITAKKITQAPAFVKVDTQKLDNMIDMVGELVINQAMLNQELSDTMVSENRKLYSSLTQLVRITSEIQRISMSMRMIPIKQTFQKMIRLIRDLSRKSGKKIVLEMKGEETEIDRNMVDEIYDPLVHLVRNSVDHGLEMPEERSAAGKSEKGIVTLNAYHKGGNIVIEITDDGKGLDREKIVNKAIEQNLIKFGENMTDTEVFNLIFQPGFSTADQITEVSGRGVGMDVVKRVLDKMRGKLEINSVKNEGTTIWMKLPLTLAIIDGIIIRAGGRDYIIPTVSVVESLRPEKAACTQVVNKGEMIKIRDNLYPIIRLHEIFGFEPNYYNPWEAIVIVAESDGRCKCILVDEIVGKQEVVIKNLGGLKKVKGMAGGAILADGRVGLIIDVSGLFEISEI
ncbi:two-component system, chemotaxis family, sensor kinase CheA [Candidatus Magnetomoraceae bacterium gMMP-15]